MNYTEDKKAYLLTTAKSYDMSFENVRYIYEHSEDHTDFDNKLEDYINHRAKFDY